MAIGSIVAIKRYFEQTDEFAPQRGRKVEMSELKALSQQERVELGKLACTQLGKEFQAPTSS